MFLFESSLLRTFWVQILTHGVQTLVDACMVAVMPPGVRHPCVTKSWDVRRCMRMMSHAWARAGHVVCVCGLHDSTARDAPLVAVVQLPGSPRLDSVCNHLEPAGRQGVTPLLRRRAGLCLCESRGTVGTGQRVPQFRPNNLRSEQQPARMCGAQHCLCRRRTTD